MTEKELRTRFSHPTPELPVEDVERLTSHKVGGVCPFGLPLPLKIYCDVSLKAFAEVVPAAGSRNSALRISPERMAQLTSAEWVDVCKDAAPQD